MVTLTAVSPDGSVLQVGNWVNTDRTLCTARVNSRTETARLVLAANNEIVDGETSSKARSHEKSLSCRVDRFF